MQPVKYPVPQNTKPAERAFVHMPFALAGTAGQLPTTAQGINRYVELLLLTPKEQAACNVATD